MIATIVAHFGDIFHMQSPFDPLHSDGYNFWSGIGSDFGEVTIVIAVLAWWKHRNCQVKGCWRIHVLKPTEAGHFVCKKHHPAHEGDQLSADYVTQAHNTALEAAGKLPHVAVSAVPAGPAPAS